MKFIPGKLYQSKENIAVYVNKGEELRRSSCFPGAWLYLESKKLVDEPKPAYVFLAGQQKIYTFFYDEDLDVFEEIQTQ